MGMSYRRVNSFQSRSVRQRRCIDGLERAGESLASRAGKNLKKPPWNSAEAMRLSRQRIGLKSGEVPKQMHTIKADPQ